MAKGLKILLEKFFIAVCLFAALSCSSRAGNHADFEIIERSKAEAPNWTENKPFTLEDTEHHFSFVSLKSQIENLSSGIKESQKLALDDSREAFLQEIKARVAAAASKANIVVTKTVELDSLVAEGVYDSYKKQAVISDIYYEKVRNNNPAPEQLSEYFQVFVRVDLQKTQVALLMEEIATRLQKTSDKNLKSLGMVLKTKNSSGRLSH